MNLACGYNPWRNPLQIDSYGHTAGDAVLRRLGDILRQFVRAGDQASRYGGEEFCILLPDTTEAQAARTAERLRLQVAGSEWQLCPVYVSLGVATFAPPANGIALSPNEFFQWADQALYAAKQQGRNRVVIARKAA
ncbi:GGDEF domain-containing protein [uncultured Thiocystis sp.]|uniref:GGDEF domain-containing protein n=1 Tax=uncultured Thiocystis sp. TaxID=1202134 RepID=UPI0025FFBCBA|nr:GGDEF domain-containing protein [uncultured Thiocystis sp.]